MHPLHNDTHLFLCLLYKTSFGRTNFRSIFFSDWSTTYFFSKLFIYKRALFPLKIFAFRAVCWFTTFVKPDFQNLWKKFQRKTQIYLFQIFNNTWLPGLDLCNFRSRLPCCQNGYVQFLLHACIESNLAY